MAYGSVLRCAEHHLLIPIAAVLLAMQFAQESAVALV